MLRSADFAPATTGPWQRFSSSYCALALLSHRSKLSPPAAAMLSGGRVHSTLAAAALRVLTGTGAPQKLQNCSQQADGLSVLLPRLLHTTGGGGGGGGGGDGGEPAARQQQQQYKERHQRHGGQSCAARQQQQPQFPAYLFNAGASLLRSDIAAFFDGTGLREEDMWCVAAAAAAPVQPILCCTHPHASTQMETLMCWPRSMRLG